MLLTGRIFPCSLLPPFPGGLRRRLAAVLRFPWVLPNARKEQASAQIGHQHVVVIVKVRGRLGVERSELDLVGPRRQVSDHWLFDTRLVAVDLVGVDRTRADVVSVDQDVRADQPNFAGENRSRDLEDLRGARAVKRRGRSRERSDFAVDHDLGNVHWFSPVVKIAATGQAITPRNLFSSVLGVAQWHEDSHELGGTTSPPNTLIPNLKHGHADPHVRAECAERSRAHS